MLTINDCLLTATMKLLILFLVLLDQRHQVKWTLLNKDDLAILDVSVSIVLFLHDATLTNVHGLEQIISADFD